MKLYSFAETFGSQYLPQSDGILIRNVSREDAGVFTCRANVWNEKNIILNLSIDFRMTSFLNIKVCDFTTKYLVSFQIIVPTKIKKDIEEIEAIEGMPVRLDCEAEGEPTPAYEFMDPHGQNITGQPGFSSTPYPGILLIEKVKREYAGIYK
ncbi:hypothetical protein QYM36_016367 [Artemia franciscana]|uniref:Ig-like domain-containing protein n=1 Tax=Artemia franciscana TaxID=6661 RepID=A0AA88L3C2_ARTSF|nr:hypothetical protein QYM36_016367 [Artemia franciscana]